MTRWEIVWVICGELEVICVLNAAKVICINIICTHTFFSWIVSDPIMLACVADIAISWICGENLTQQQFYFSLHTDVCGLELLTLLVLR